MVEKGTTHSLYTSIIMPKANQSRQHFGTKELDPEMKVNIEPDSIKEKSAWYGCWPLTKLITAGSCKLKELGVSTTWWIKVKWGEASNQVRLKFLIGRLYSTNSVLFFPVAVYYVRKINQALIGLEGPCNNKFVLTTTPPTLAISYSSRKRKLICFN